mgnify:CR=1 FL=1
MDAFRLHTAAERRVLLAKTIATVSPPPAAPPPFPSSPLTNVPYEDYQPGLGLLLVISLCGLVLLAACALCRLRSSSCRRRREDQERCCDSLIFTFCTSHRRLSRWWTRGSTELSAVVGESEDATGGRAPGGSRGHPLQRTLSGEISDGPNLPSQRAQVAGASEMAEMAELGSSSSDPEHELDSDAAAITRAARVQSRLREQLRALPPLGALEQREPHGRHVHVHAAGLGALGALGGAPGPGGDEPQQSAPRSQAAGALDPCLDPVHPRLPEAREPVVPTPRERALRTAVAAARPDELRGGPAPEELLPVEPPWHAGAGRSEDPAWGRRRAL